MTSTRTLYATTLLFAGLAGFSTGWATKPQDVKVIVSPEEQRMLEYEANYRLAPAEVQELRGLVHAYFRDLDDLAKEFDRKYEGQVQAVVDRYDGKIRALCTEAKRR
jgi:hypothetical protein